jgi:hypothetical protein
MNLYIETENGVTKNHPAYEDNLILAFGEIPSRWEPFIRIIAPELGLYQKFDDPGYSYQKINGVWTDVWMIRDMTDTEKAAKQQITRDLWAVRPNAANFTAWILDEATNTMVPPIPRPTEGRYFWQGTTNSWQVPLERPDDGKSYKINFTTGGWDEEVV